MFLHRIQSGGLVNQEEEIMIIVLSLVKLMEGNGKLHLVIQRKNMFAGCHVSSNYGKVYSILGSKKR